MLKNIAVIDKTGRGHAICDCLIANNPDLTVHYIPGTGGAFDQRIAVVPNIDIEDGAAILDYCDQSKMDLIIVSHIDALKSGVCDTLRKGGLSVLGPSATAVQLETSKWFCKKICKTAGISTPQSQLFHDKAEFVSYLKTRGPSRVMIKADWLTKNGNGAFIAQGTDCRGVILDEIETIMKQNPDAPFRFLVETYQDGTDYSAHYMVNEGSVVDLPSSQDFKKSHENDAGHNCDGMGSLSPHPLDSTALRYRIRTSILEPMLAALQDEVGCFNGPIYLGLRVDENGQPHLIEVNARMGDSESEVIFPLISEDLAHLCKQLADGHTVDRPAKASSQCALVISLVTGRTGGTLSLIHI